MSGTLFPARDVRCRIELWWLLTAEGIVNHAKSSCSIVVLRFVGVLFATDFCRMLTAGRRSSCAPRLILYVAEASRAMNRRHAFWDSTRTSTCTDIFLSPEPETNARKSGVVCLFTCCGCLSTCCCCWEQQEDEESFGAEACAQCCTNTHLWCVLLCKGNTFVPFSRSLENTPNLNQYVERRWRLKARSRVEVQKWTCRDVSASEAKATWKRCALERRNTHLLLRVLQSYYWTFVMFETWINCTISAQ